MRINGGFQINHHPHGVGRILTGANATDIRIATLNFAAQTLQHIVEGDAADIDDQAARVIDGEIFVIQTLAGFQRNPGISVGGPNTYGDKLRCSPLAPSQRADTENQAGAGGAHDLTAG